MKGRSKTQEMQVLNKPPSCKGVTNNQQPVSIFSCASSKQATNLARYMRNISNEAELRLTMMDAAGRCSAFKKRRTRLQSEVVSKPNW